MTVCVLLVLLGQVQLTSGLFGHHLHLRLDEQLMLYAAALIHSLDPSTQGLAGLAHLSHRLRHKMGTVNYLSELLQLFICQSVAVKKFQLLGEILERKQSQISLLHHCMPLLNHC